MDNIVQRLKAYIEEPPFDPGESDCQTVLEQLYQACTECHEIVPSEIGDGFRGLEDFLHTLPLEDNNAVFNLRIGAGAGLTIIYVSAMIHCD